MDPSFRLQLLLAFALLILVLVGFMMLMRTVNSIAHTLERVEEVVAQELLLSFQKHAIERRIDLQANIMEKDRSRRNELLLNIPLMRELRKRKKI